MTVTRSTTLTDDDCTRYTVSGDSGAVTCSTLPGSRVPFMIDYHLPVPDSDKAFACDVLAAGICRPEAGCGATELCEAWSEAGNDDGVIWTALERLYAQMEA